MSQCSQLQVSVTIEYELDSLFMNYFTFSESYLFGTGLTDIKPEISKPPLTFTQPPLRLRSGYALLQVKSENL